MFLLVFGGQFLLSINWEQMIVAFHSCLMLPSINWCLNFSLRDFCLSTNLLHWRSGKNCDQQQSGVFVSCSFPAVLESAGSKADLNSLTRWGLDGDHNYDSLVLSFGCSPSILSLWSPIWVYPAQQKYKYDFFSFKKKLFAVSFTQFKFKS